MKVSRSVRQAGGCMKRCSCELGIMDFRGLIAIGASSEVALHRAKTLISGLFKRPLRAAQHSLPLKDSPRYLALSPIAGVVALCYHGAVIQLNAIGMA